MSILLLLCFQIKTKDKSSIILIQLVILLKKVLTHYITDGEKSNQNQNQNQNHNQNQINLNQIKSMPF